MMNLTPNIFRKTVLVVASIFVLATVLALVCRPETATAGNNLCDNVTLESIKKHVPIPPHAEILSKESVMGICEVILEVSSELVPVYVSPNNSFVIAGEMFADKKQISKQRLDKLNDVAAAKTKKTFISLIPQIEQAAGITYSPQGKINKKLYMVGATNCPHCVTAAKNIQPILDSTGTKLFILLQGNGNARTMAITAVCKNVDLHTYNRHQWEPKESIDEKSLCAEGIKKITSATDLSAKLGVRGVPTFFLEDGSQVVGANMAELQKRLSAAN